MFIPSFLKSAPQPVQVNVGSGALSAQSVISSVDLNSSIILWLGAISNGGGGFVFGPNHTYLSFADATHVQGNALSTGDGSNRSVRGLVLEFIHGFLIQNIYFNTVDLNNVNTNTHNSGLTLGSKAFVVLAGWTGNYNTPSSIIDSIEMIDLSLNIATGVVTATRGGNSGADNVRVAFFIVDPR